jgi:hypothetical protein
MKGSTHSIYLALGCAAVLAGSSACSHSTPEPSSPPLGTSPGRSTIQDQTPASTGGSNMAQPGFDSERETQGATPQGAVPQGQPGGPGTSGNVIEPLASINEREACELLVSQAMLHAEPIEGGVVIVAKPRRTSDVSTVRTQMQAIHRGIERGGPASAEVQCDLFALGRNGVASLIETPDSIRLLVTTSDAARVPHLRRQANEFIRSKGMPAQRGGPPKGGTHSGGTPQHPDETPQPPTP